MQNFQKMSLSRATFMFPLALVLFEFSVYICNDLVQPAMLVITQDFGVSSAWTPSSMSFFLLGGAFLSWLLGPLSDRIGRKKVLLAGVLFFVVCNLLIVFTQNIAQFLIFRLLQGIGLTIVAAVGYAAIQEIFEERDAIKVMAIMANISLIAPLLGPIVGAFMIEHVSWHWGFVGIATLAAVSWFGLKLKMPDQHVVLTKRPLGGIWDDFKSVFKNPRFMGLSLTLPIVAIPLILWIALSPVILVEELGLSNMQYGLAQVPVLGALIIGNIVLIKIIDRLPLGKTVMWALPLMFIGALVLIVGVIWTDYLLWCLIIGMTIMGFAEGCSFSVLYRFALTASDVPQGTVAAAVNMILMVAFFGIIELVRILYEQYGMWSYALSCLILVALWFGFPRSIVKNIMRERLIKGES